jgi:hypothetical protein
VLAFIDESGDLGYKFKRGSTPFFTLAVVVFENPEVALNCQRAIEKLRDELGLPSSFEFHFTDDGHDRRLALLSRTLPFEFRCYTFTLDKTSPRVTGPGLRIKEPAYKWVCARTLENVADDLEDATVVIDGSGDRTFKRQLRTYLRRELNSEQRQRIKKVTLSRSDSDPLVQLADYVAGVTNRLWLAKSGAEAYNDYLKKKRQSTRRWPA